MSSADTSVESSAPPGPASVTDVGGEVIETGTETVRAQIVDGVGVVTLNRPERRNALHLDMYDAVPRLLERFAGDPGIGAVMITAAGTAFCAGGDVRDGRRRREDSAPEESVADRTAGLTHNARMVRLLHDMPKITIAALPGPAVGAGLSIALSTDLRIVSASTALIPGWGKLAFTGDFGGTWFLTRLVGPSVALDLLTSGAPIDAARALQLGLVNRVVPDEELPTAALDWARTIAAGPSGAWAGMKANVAQAETMTLDEALPLESERMVRSGLTEEHAEAVRRWLRAARARTER